MRLFLEGKLYLALYLLIIPQIFTLVPDQLNFTGSPAVDVFGVSNVSIVVAAEVNNVVAASGTTGNYKLNSILPNVAGVVSGIAVAAANANLTITGLAAGTSYDLGFVNVVNICSADQVSAETLVNDVCTSEKYFLNFLNFCWRVKIFYFLTKTE